MKGKAIIPLVLGLAIGVFAIKMFFNVLNKAKGGTGETVQVVRARVDIAPTIEITDQMIEMAAVPESLCPKQAVRDKKEVLGRVTANSIPQGCPVVQSLLAPKGTLPGMAARIKDGYRAVAVKVDETIGVAGWIKPGSRVDVIAVMQVKSGKENETVSRVILQNLEVLAVGQDIGNSGETNANVPKSVTLLVAPDDVTKLHLAATKGTLRLAMRNQYDSTPLGEASSTTDNEILGISNNTANDSKKPSFWSGLLGNLGKSQMKATDKQVEKRPAAPKKPPVLVAAAPQPGWVVEVVSSGRTADLAFTGSDKSGRWMDLEKIRAVAAAAAAAAPPAPAEGSEQQPEQPPVPLKLRKLLNPPTGAEKEAASQPSDS